MDKLLLQNIKDDSRRFLTYLSSMPIPALYGSTDGKAIGTFVEHEFHQFLKSKYIYEQGSSAKGIDFPELEIDLKVTSVQQPQSSCPFRSAQQKIYGLGYHLLVFVYQKSDNHAEAVT